MTDLTIQTVAPARSYGALIYDDLPREALERPASAPIAEPARLLAAAVRLFNYGIDDPAAAVRKPGKIFPPLSAESVAAAVEALCAALTGSVVQMADRLVRRPPQGVAPLEGLEKWKDTSSERSLRAAGALLADRFRPSRPPRKKARSPAFRRFEDLATAQERLRNLVSETSIERSFGRDFGRELALGADATAFLFQPAWGGKRILRPAAGDGAGLPGPELSSPAARIGPVEKLYAGVASELFSDAHEAARIRLRRSSRYRKCWLSAGASESCSWLASATAHVETIEALLPPVPKGASEDLAAWRRWQDGLDTLEILFGEAARLRHLDPAARDYSLLRPAPPAKPPDSPFPSYLHLPGIEVGLPAALALVSVLRLYFADLAARALKVALYRALVPIYETVSGYLAIALWEALANRDTPAVGEPGCLSGWGAPALRGKLRSWRRAAADDFWGRALPVERAAADRLAALHKKPLIDARAFNDRDDARRQYASVPSSYGFDDFAERFAPRHPPIRPGLYEALGTEPKWLPDAWLCGVSFTVQAHAFVALQLIGRAASILSWDEPPDVEPRGMRRGWPPFVSAGSNLYGGKKYPHLTHRRGVNLDVNFGPDLVAWPVADAGAALQTLRRKKEGRQRLEELVVGDLADFPQLEKGRVRPLIVRYTAPQWWEAATVRSRPVLFSSLAKPQIRAAIRAVRHRLDGTSGSDESPDLACAPIELPAWYAGVERRLAGFPHFAEPSTARRFGVPWDETPELRDRQRTHAAHAALLLSAPRQIIFASPIVHTRAMYAVFRLLDGHLRWTGTEEDDKAEELAKELLRSVSFVFLPHNHHHHWHLDYPHDLAPGAFEPRIARFEELAPLWRALGVDLRPFHEYLKGYEVAGGAPLEAARKEREKLLTACRKYIDHPAAPSRDGSRQPGSVLAVERLFSAFRKGSPLIRPTIAARHFVRPAAVPALAAPISRSRRIYAALCRLLREHLRPEEFKSFRLWAEVTEYLEAPGLKEDPGTEQIEETEEEAGGTEAD